MSKLHEQLYQHQIDAARYMVGDYSQAESRVHRSGTPQRPVVHFPYGGHAGSWGIQDRAAMMRAFGASEYKINKTLGASGLHQPPKVFNGKPATFTRWMRSRVRSGMDIKRALAEQQKWMTDHGTTLEGYMAHYNAQGDSPLVRGVWKADHEFLLHLIQCGLLEAAGHKVDQEHIWKMASLPRGIHEHAAK